MRARVVAELGVVALGLPLLAWVVRADPAWLVRHWSIDEGSAGTALAWRAGPALLTALLVVVVRPRVGRWVDATGGRAAAAALARLTVAALLALGVSEVALRAVGRPKKHDLRGSCDNEMGEPDPRTGWRWRGPYARTVVQGGRPIDFAFDAHHDRVASPGATEDPDRPTILLVGESIVAGHGLSWGESLPALVGEALGVQVVDLGVDGYGSDQAFVRLVDAAPRFAHLRAVVTLFFPGLADRVAWTDRPRLSLDGDAPVIAPPATGFWGDLRVARVVRDLLPYRDDETLALVGRIFRETDRLARGRGARAVFLAPYLGRGWPRGDGYLVRELLTAQGLEVVDPDWRYEGLPGDRHPDAASTRRLAGALVAALSRDPPPRDERRGSGADPAQGQ